MSEYIYVNWTNGAIYLLKNIDREKILNIKFSLFVRDRKDENDKNTLINQVDVTIEFIDINDSKPVCTSVYLATAVQNDERRLIDAFALRIDLDKLQFIVANFKLAKLYKFNCYDNDLNKNAKLKYEIDRYFLKEVNPNRRRTPSSLSITNTKVEEFIYKNKIFTIDSHSGIVYMNLSSDWSFHEFINELRSLLARKYLLIKVRVSDNGIVSLFKEYYLKLLFCFSMDDFKMCEFSASEMRKNKTLLIKPLTIAGLDESSSSAGDYEEKLTGTSTTAPIDEITSRKGDRKENYSPSQFSLDEKFDSIENSSIRFRSNYFFICICFMIFLLDF